MWPGARAEDAESAGKRVGRDVSDTLTAVARDVLDAWTAPNEWRAPAVNDPGILPERLVTAEGKPWTQGERAYDAETGRMCQTGLTQQAANWAGPQARDVFPAHTPEYIAAKKAQGHSMRNLNDEAAQFHPPSSPDHPTIAGGALCSTDTPNTNQPSVKRKLNPIFVEALMRWPTGLSGFGRPETAWIQWQQQQLSFLSTIFSQPEAAQQELF